METQKTTTTNNGGVTAGATRITFCTGVGTVTGANFLMETPVGTKVLVDCGMVQGERVAKAENRDAFAYDLTKISALFITHAHLDHVGRIPKIVKDGYSGPIYSTPVTRELAEVVLTDAVRIIDMEARQDGLEPIYNASDVQQVFPLWKTIEYHESFRLSDDVTVILKDAGHILGSAMFEFTVEQGTGSSQLAARSEKILFTGDLGNSPAPLLRDTEPVGDVDYIVMESVYGDRNHIAREERSEELEEIIKAAISRGGTLVIPAFSIDRTQVILYELNNMVEQGRIQSVPVFVDSPMAIKATEIYKEHEDLFNERVQEQIKKGDDIFAFPHLEFTVANDDSRTIERIQGAKIILAGSGMSVGGRIISHEEFYLPDPKNTLLLVGYQALGSLGRELADGAKKVQIHHRTVKVKAKVETIFGYSAHKDGDHLVEFVSTGTDKLKKVFVVMGEPKASMHLAQRLSDELGVKAVVPERLKPYSLDK